MRVNYGFHEMDEALAFIVELLPVLLPIFLIGTVIVIVALVNLIKKPLPFQHKVPWLIVILVINLLGPIIYLTVGSRILDNKVANQEEDRQ